jgi:DNA-binding beta-propeller fold protein YncE
VVTPVDTVTHTAGAPVVVAKGGQSIAVTPNGKSVYVPITSLNAVIPIRTATNTALAPIPVADIPYPIIVTPNGRTVYVGNTNSDSEAAIRVSRASQHSGWQWAEPPGVKLKASSASTEGKLADSIIEDILQL